MKISDDQVKEKCLHGTLAVMGKEAQYLITQRSPKAPEAPGPMCFDLTVQDRNGIAFFPDISRSEAHINRIIELFCRMKVTSSEAEYIVEDLLADPYWLE